MATETCAEEVCEKAADLQSQLAAGIGSETGSNLAELNRAFHFTIYEAASPIISTVIRPLWLFLPTNASLWADVPTARRFSRHHEAILSAMVARDPDLAESLMAEHINAARDGRLADACS